MRELDDCAKYGRYEKMLFEKLINEKQFLTDENRNIIESKMIDTGYFNTKHTFSDKLDFKIELTRGCNMRCVYCYVKSLINNNIYMTPAHIDAIYNFLSGYSDSKNKVEHVQTIEITGGETLLNETTLRLINYVSKKWPHSKLNLLTNGVNLLKFYGQLPLKSIGQVKIPLDGTEDVHLHRRYSGKIVDRQIYTNIINGIKQLLKDNVAVSIQSVIDKNSYQSFEHLVSLLENEKINCASHFEHFTSVVSDYSDPLDLNINFNSKEDVNKISEYFIKRGYQPHHFLPSSVSLLRALSRAANEPMTLKHQRCRSDFLANYYFACDGNVYFCDCIENGKGVVGTYFPHASIDRDAISVLQNRSVMNHNKCRHCAYKFVCLGGCILSSLYKNEEMSCGIYGDDEILDNLKFDLFSKT